MTVFDNWERSHSRLRSGVLVCVFAINIILIVAFGWVSLFGLLPFNVLIVISKAWRFITRDVLVSDASVIVTQYNIFAGESRYNFSADKLDYTYRNRPIKYQNRFYMGSNRGDELTLFFDGYALFDLTPDVNGWTDRKIKSLVSDLKRTGIKQILDKFGDKDVVV